MEPTLHPPQNTPIALALGSNLGDRWAALRGAVKAFANIMHVQACSKVYETPAAYVTDQPAFLNMAVLASTVLEPLPLLWALKKLETKLGRMPTFRYGPRVLDIDILFYGTTVMTAPELTLPHPRMIEREFVLRPLADIAPQWTHPITGATVSDMLRTLPEQTARSLGDL